LALPVAQRVLDTTAISRRVLGAAVLFRRTILFWPLGWQSGRRRSQPSLGSVAAARRGPSRTRCDSDEREAVILDALASRGYLEAEGNPFSFHHVQLMSLANQIPRLRHIRHLRQERTEAVAASRAAARRCHDC